MKTFRTLAIAATLFTTASGLALAPPALAKKKEEAAKPGLKLSPAALKAAQTAQPAITAKDFATAEPAVVALEAAATTDDDKYLAAGLRYDLEQQKISAARAANPNAPVNETVLAAPLDTLIASPSTPADMRPKYAYQRGQLSFIGKQYPQALRYFAQAKQLGYADSNIDLQTAQAKVETGDVAGGLADIDTSIAKSTAAGQKAPEDYYRYAIAKANAKKMGPETFAWLKKYVAAYPSAKTWRDVIVTYGLQQGSIAPALDAGQKIDLYRLMRATSSLADQADYGDYAQKVFDKGLPSETLAVVKEGMSSGKFPPKNSYALSLQTAAATAARNEGSLAGLEKKAAAGANGKLAAQTGDAYLGQDNYAKATELYRVALQKGGIDADEVNTHLGIALAKSGDKAGAKTAFGAVTGAPRKDIAGLWTTWLDQSAA